VAERLIGSGPQALCVETFGDSDDPAILLVGSAAMSMDGATNP
jgi:hypothetical protein